MKVKICGLTNYDDAREADRLGADYLGFIFYQNSKRSIDSESVAKILEELQPKAIPVAVFVNETFEKIMETCTNCQIQTVQLHGEETSDLIEKLQQKKIKVIKVFRVRDRDFSLVDPLEYPFLLWEPWHPTKKGGTGQTFDWTIFKGKKDILERSFFAGGLNPENISGLLDKVRPYAIDLSSGVEEYPGKKNFKKLEQLFLAIKDKDGYKN